ncbi:hypothetical protein K431DRAFT_285083 [Polychaeton citri CBS 116435]|uniref:Uncharacterized protein n=1 Tax=Polychaeton citri CBS 116435 TaxID=1314669 RepID=A0A9P4Q8N3_9PEZI|nr:hypothetical protein K431DRAFT_285083 [Polychaeton citri CBS 116435]
MSSLLRKLRNFRKRRHIRRDKASHPDQIAVPHQNGYPQPSTGLREQTDARTHDGWATHASTEDLATDLNRLDIRDSSNRHRSDFTTDRNPAQPSSLAYHDTRLPGYEQAGEGAYDVADPSYSSGDEYPSQHRRSIAENYRGTDSDARLPDHNAITPGLQPRPGNTTVHERIAPAVTHETVHKEVHHVRQEHITRDIHHHHVVHRVLPLVDVETLPTRHFVPTETGLKEVSEREIPSHTTAMTMADYAAHRQKDNGHLAGRQELAPRML